MKKAFSKNHFFLLPALSLLLSMSSFSTQAATSYNQNKCLVSIDSLNKAKNLNTLLYVDVRDASSFNTKHILNSINIPYHLLEIKSFLKAKKVILIGNGWNESALIEKCDDLLNSGFKSVRVLTGGIISWFNKKNKVSKRELVTLTAKEFFNNNTEKKFVPVVLLNKEPGSKQKKEIYSVLPHAKIISLKKSKKQLVQNLKALGKGANPIVIFSNTRYVVDATVNEYYRNPLRKMFYFEGGYDAYHEIIKLNKMTALGNDKKRLSTKKPVSCAN